MYTAVMRALDAAGIPYEVRPHSRSVFTVEEAAQERGVSAGQIVKVMLVRKSDHTLVAALIPGDCRLSLKKLSLAIGDRRMTLATHAEIEAATGFTVGAISPIGLPAAMPIYADRHILLNETVAISSGSPDAGLLLKSVQLLTHVGGTMGDFAA